MKEIRSPVQASAAGQPKPERERFTLPQDWDRRCASATATLAQPHAASLACPELPGSVKLYCASVLLQFPRAIPESRIDAGLRAISPARLVTKLLDAIADSDQQLLMVLESWFPMRETSRATRRQIDAAAAARTPADLQATTKQWKRSPDTPLQLSDTYAYFLAGLCDGGHNCSTPPSLSSHLVADQISEMVHSTLGIKPVVRFQFNTDFMTGLRATVWDCQTLRLLAVARDLVAKAGSVRADLAAVVSAESHAINVAFHTSSQDDPSRCYRVEGDLHGVPTVAVASLAELLATIPGVVVRTLAETTRREQLRRFADVHRNGGLPGIVHRL